MGSGGRDYSVVETLIAQSLLNLLKNGASPSRYDEDASDLFT